MLWKTERPLKYETMRPVKMRPLSAVVSSTVKQRPPTLRRNVRSAAIRRPRRPADLLTTDQRPDATGDSHVTGDDHVTGRKLTTTPDNSDAEDDRKNNRRADAKGSKYEDRRKNRTRMTEEKFSQRMESQRMTGLECAEGLEEETRRTKLMEDRFKQRVLQLQQQLGLTTEGFVVPS